MNLFQKLFKSSFEKEVIKNGYKDMGKAVANNINNKITSKDLALQFVLEELDAAQYGHEIAQQFAKNSGFNFNEYNNSMRKTKWNDAKNKLEVIQLYFRNYLSQFQDPILMVNFAVSTVDEVMKSWKLGKYDDSKIEEKTYKILLSEDDLHNVKSLMNANLMFFNDDEFLIKRIIEIIDESFIKQNEILFMTKKEILYIYNLYKTHNDIKMLTGNPSVYGYYVDKFYNILNTLEESNNI